MALIWISLMAAGFLLGLQHSFESDHVAAVATMASKSRSLKERSSAGLFWGIGHTMMLVLAVIAVFLLKISIPETFTAFAEIAVGVMLIVLGLFSVPNFINGYHFHFHQHEKQQHAHFHKHEKTSILHEHMHKNINKKTFAIGALHGMAGSGTLVVLLSTVAATFAGSLIYVLVFGIGSISGMMLSSTLIGMPLRMTKEKFTNAHNFLGTGIGLLSAVIGVAHIAGVA